MSMSGEGGREGEAVSSSVGDGFDDGPCNPLAVFRRPGMGRQTNPWDHTVRCPWLIELVECVHARWRTEWRGRWWGGGGTRLGKERRSELLLTLYKSQWRGRRRVNRVMTREW